MGEVALLLAPVGLQTEGPHVFSELNTSADSVSRGLINDTLLGKTAPPPERTTWRLLPCEVSCPLRREGTPLA